MSTCLQEELELKWVCLLSSPIFHAYVFMLLPPSQKGGSLLLLVWLILFSCLASHSSGVPVRFSCLSAVPSADIVFCLATSMTLMCPTCSYAHFSLSFWQSPCSHPYAKLWLCHHSIKQYLHAIASYTVLTCSYWGLRQANINYMPINTLLIYM